MLEVISSIISILSWGYIVTQLKGKKINIKKYKNIILVILMIFISYIAGITNIGFSKTIIVYSLFTLCYKYIYNISFKESSILNFISIMLHCISEVVSAILLILLKINSSLLEKYFYLTPLSGLLVFLIVIIIYNIFRNKINKLYYFLKGQTFDKIFYIILIICFSILFSINISSWNDKNIISNIMIIAVFGIILFLLFKEKLEMNKVNKKFNDLFKNSQRVSSLLEKYQKINHENENDLKVIRSKAKGNKEIEEYVNLLLKEKKTTEDSKWISELNKINEIGINGFLSLKINEMIDNNTKIIVNISNKVKDYNFKKLSIKEQKDLCRMLGVYLDNAYDASKESEEKEITLEINTTEKGLEIIISNTFSGNLDLNKIGKYGYTTKGKGHGTGLSLVNDIINKNNLFIQNREIMKNYYFQYLYINK